MNLGDIYNVKIDKLTNSAFGLAKIDGMVIFIENACPEDYAKIKITKINKKYATAKIIEIITPSPNRITPKCPMQKICGACQIQYIDYDYQLNIKQQIVSDTIKTIGNIYINIPKTIPSPEKYNYRHKIQYSISQTKNSKRILAGYYKKGTHEVINIKYCPIQPKICDDIMEYVRINAPLFGIDGYIEKNNTGLLKHLIIRHSHKTKKNLICLVINSKIISNNLKSFAQKIFNEFADVSGICVNFNPKQTNIILGNKTVCLCGTEAIEEGICDKTFHIGADTFFQINPLSAQNIFNYIKRYISDKYNKPTILDAYAGISAIGICLSDVASKVVSIEENKKSVELACKTAKFNNINNIEINGGDAEEFFKNEKREFDIVILDPPRKGCTEKSLDYALKLCRGHIIYVSCNPATLARDLKYLNEKGCKIESIQPFDMFCHTTHIENVAIIKI